jgi:spore germination cell wall hydrolase CwlJ-like protein
MNKKEVAVVAKTIYGEARGEYYHRQGGTHALIAIGNVVMNRAAASGESVTEVCLKPKQFSCWNADDPNRELLDRVTITDKIYELCYAIAMKILTEELQDFTGGATHYYSRKILKTPPKWAENKTPTTRIGNHIFYRL